MHIRGFIIIIIFLLFIIIIYDSKFWFCLQYS